MKCDSSCSRSQNIQKEEMTKIDDLKVSFSLAEGAQTSAQNDQGDILLLYQDSCIKQRFFFVE